MMLPNIDKILPSAECVMALENIVPAGLW